MKAYCYHVRVPGKDSELALIDVWRRSWTKAGWLPVVLNESHAQRHPRFHYYRDKFWALPTVNNHEYEVACFMRWVAMAHLGGGLLTDYDVINYGFGPRPPDSQRLTVIASNAGTMCPGCVLGTGAHFQRMADIFSEWVPDARDVDNYQSAGRPHCSDMTILDRVFNSDPKPDWIAGEGGNIFWNDAGWQTSKLVHFCHRVEAAHGPRSKCIERLRPF